MRLLLWHVHGSWTTAFVQGRHQYFVPVLPGRGPDGRGRARTWRWPSSVGEVTPRAMRELELDAVILQRPHELRLTEEWLGRRPGAELPALYVEHNAPQGQIGEMRHPLSGRSDLTLVHVTHFNDLFWDARGTPTRVIEHGIVDPGYRYTGELPRVAAVINEAPRRGRVTGTDLLRRLGAGTPIDLFGMDAATLGGIDDVPQGSLHGEMARRRVYLHPIRWTSLGLSLIEAMHLGMPVVALATTEAPEAVPPQAGLVSTRVDALAQAIREFMGEPERAVEAGRAGRAAARRRYGLGRFLADWDSLLGEVAR
jgi:glycosyltransferase involved in cell wall biosynthesis